MFLLGSCFKSSFSDFCIVHFGLLFFERDLAYNQLLRLPKNIFNNLSTLQQL